MGEQRVGSTLIVRKKKLLLIKSKVGAAKGLWNNPGGRLNPDESYEEGARRETSEETGFNVKLGRLINTYQFKDDKNSWITKKVFEAFIVSGELNFPDDEIQDIKWFTLNEILTTKESKLTFGARKSIQDYSSNKFNVVYYPQKIA